MSDLLDEACGRLWDCPRDYEKVVNEHPDLEAELRAFIEKHLVGLSPGQFSDPTTLRECGHYRILYRLGIGGIGAVFLARDHTLNRLVAIKVLLRKHRNKDR